MNLKDIPRMEKQAKLSVRNVFQAIIHYMIALIVNHVQLDFIATPVLWTIVSAVYQVTTNKYHFVKATYLLFTHIRIFHV